VVVIARWIVVVLALLTGVGAALPARAVSASHGWPVPVQVVQPTERSIDVGGYRLYLRCAGQGAPTVIFDNAGFLDQWDAAQATIGGFRHTCAYDREGAGQSDAGPGTVTVGRLVRDLTRLLREGDIPGPYVLVGNGFGGSVAYRYARRHPAQTAGLVLLDAIPDGLLAPVAHATLTGVAAGAASGDAVAGSLHALPLVVVSHGVGYHLPHPIESRWTRDQGVLVRLSSNSRFVQAQHSVFGNIPGQQLGLVLAAVSQVLLAVRDPGTSLETCNVYYWANGGKCEDVSVAASR
jgi:pimeloyl-ACP methyl ester carboxylesterase